MARLILFAPFLAITIGAVYFLFFKSPPPLPELDLDEWWGPKQLKTKQDTSIRPFKVKFDEGMIIDLKQRLKNHRKWTPPLEGVAFEYGFNTNQLDSWVSYWAEKYDFKAREAALNKYPQFKANIQGLDIHFIRVTPEAPGKEVVPMLLLHGWPGSVREFHESIPLLTAVRSDRDFALEVIVPSLPGYGFSDASVKPGLGPAELAVVFRNLMQRLGFEKYYIQGGDAGSVIGSNMATLFPKEVLGFHTNMAMVMSPLATVTEVLGSFFPSLIVEKELQHRLYPMSTVWAHLLEESGYVHLQSTKPDTAGVALADSPVGLLAYILEKFSTWTNKGFKYHPDGGLSKKFTKDQLIDNLMYYWSTNSVTTSFRLYAESFCKKQMGYRMAEIPTPVPTWAIQAGHELTYQPPLILKYKFTNLLNTTVFSDGGHFFAFEMPKEFSDNVLSAVDEFRKFAKAKAKTELASVKPGLGPAELAVVFRNFMQRLGFEKYYIQGGDAGSVIGSNMATLFPKEVLGFHTNMAMVMSPLATVTEVLGSFFPSLIVEKELQHRLYPMSTVWAHLLEESGYVHLQSTKPDTAGVALADSPVGLLAYILEKFSTWTNKGFKYHPDGGLSKKFTKDQLIDNLMYYWSTNSVTTSFRLYAESFCKKQMGYRMAEIPTPVPTWAIQAGHELTYQPPLILKYKFTNLLNTTVFSDGGHFFAFEMPKEFSDNVLSAVDEFRKFAKAKAKTEL